jgi:hypothetical protein
MGLPLRLNGGAHRIVLIAGGKNGINHSPIGANGRIIPCNAKFIGGVVIAIY